MGHKQTVQTQIRCYMKFMCFILFQHVYCHKLFLNKGNIKDKVVDFNLHPKFLNISLHTEQQINVLIGRC